MIHMTTTKTIKGIEITTETAELWIVGNKGPKVFTDLEEAKAKARFAAEMIGRDKVKLKKSTVVTMIPADSDEEGALEDFEERLAQDRAAGCYDESPEPVVRWIVTGKRTEKL
jgi:alkanesulfonate monooxygenase SsuD/methylene tetrahydromethanopterin reductase-like flavin-dependent oxidoreductase (luciferase family)